MVGTWYEAYASQLSPKTRMHYRQLLNKHIPPSLGPLELRAIRPETIGRWQAERLAAGHDRVSVRYALTLLGAVLQRAFENGQIQSNPARAVRKAALPDGLEVRPLAPATIERMRAASTPRDATLISVLAYAGLRPLTPPGARRAAPVLPPPEPDAAPRGAPGGHQVDSRRPLVSSDDQIEPVIPWTRRDTSGQLDLLCKQEVAGSIPAGSTSRSAWK